MNETTQLNMAGQATADQAARLREIGIGSDRQENDIDLAYLLGKIPSIIYSCDCMGKIKPYQWTMWRTEASSFELDGETCLSPGVYGLMYQTFSVMPSDHPIMPNAPHFESLIGDDGNFELWSDESPVEMCIKVLEWLYAHNYLENSDKE